ncbi:RAF-like serine/threonine-protein kinase 20 [Silene latifolia]|uniref:RAF-like serine/threonine-protein kinase 20 n=1 Tax=Silene latifolia TaxID=37657 RepID=UPI003D780F6E
MAFDPNSVSKDLRRINVARTDETHIAQSVPTTSGRVSDGFTPNSVLQRGDELTSPPSGVVYYNNNNNNNVPGVSGVGFVNPSGPHPGLVPGWVGAGAGQQASSNVGSSGYVCSPSYGGRGNGNGNGNGGSSGGTVATPSDQASEESGEDSVSGKKVKFLCSFGGKILPRPSDGTLRYVGGQTRIISFRRNVTFPELVQKMVETYGQPVCIKYQLPFEDLDALVSVSCPDDLENMMEEYYKLLESSPDGSAKLRVFLFSASEVNSPTGLVHFGDLQDSGHRYMDAVNGIAEGFGGGITRKESLASVTSTQNSDMSGAELIDAALNNLDISGPPSNAMFSPRADDNALRVETSVPPLIAPAQPVFQIERTVPLQAHGQQQLQGYDLQQTAVNFPPPPSSYLTGYADPHRDAFSGADFQQLPSPQVVYANPQVLGNPRPVLIQPQYRDNGPMMTQQFMPAVQMTVSPASHMSINPNIVQPQRVVAVPAEQTYINAYPPQVSGGYGWRQVASPDHVPYSEGWLPHPQVVPRSADCYMCQKALPHAHSDTIVQDQKGSHSAMGSDTNPVFHSLRLDDVSRIHAVAPTSTPGEMGLASNVQGPYGTITANVSPSSPEDALHKHLVASSQQIQEPLGSRPANGDSSPVGNISYQIPEQNPYILRSAISHENVKPVEFVRENLQTKPSDILSGNEQNKSPHHQYRKDEFFDQGAAQTLGRETMSNVTYSTPNPPNPFEGLQSNPPIVDIMSPIKDLADDTTRFSAVGGGGAENVTSNASVQTSFSPHDWIAGGGDAAANSLYSSQDPWTMMPEAHFPPPKPTKITMRREPSAKELHVGETNLNSEAQSSDAVNPALEQVQTAKGSADDHIKQQLQATAEGVAASVLQSPVPSITDYSSQETAASVSESGHEMDGQNSDAHIQAKMEALKIKPEKANFGFPVSDTMGRLQIIKNSDLEELRELGSGTFGTVYHGKWRGTDVAIKRINDRCFAGKASEQERMRDDFWNEAKKLADLHHPNVVAFYGVVLDGPGGSVATVTEYMVNGSLRTALEKNERNLDKRKRLLIAMDVAFGMEYLHSKNIVHFDLKSDNLLVNLRDPHRPICKVGDLGLSKVKCQTLISGGVRGTLPWMAPELLNGSSNLVSEKVDVFSFGIVMWELLTGEEPYADLHYGTIIGGIVSNTLRPAVPENCDPNWRTLMERCWSAETSERPNFTEIANELRAMASKVPSKAQTPTTAAPTTTTTATTTTTKTTNV